MITEDLIKVLENLFGDKYLFVKEEKRDYDFDGNVGVLSEYSGENYSSAFVYNYQLSVYTNNVEETMQEMDIYAHQLNDTIFQTKDFQFVKLLVGAPTNITNFQITRNDYTGVISLSIQALAAKGAEEVRYIEIDGVAYMTTRVMITYQSELSSVNGQNEKLNDSQIGRATLLIQCTIPAVESMTLLKNHMFDNTVSKNRPYDLNIVWSDGTETPINVKIKDIAHSSERGALPLYTVTFTYTVDANLLS